MGGTASNTLKKKTAIVVAQGDTISDKLRVALSMSIPVVTVDWVEQCTEQDRLLDPASFRFQVLRGRTIAVWERVHDDLIWKRYIERMVLLLSDLILQWRVSVWLSWKSKKPAP